MEDLGVSRNFVREALKALRALDIVEIRHGYGTYVGKASLTPLVDGLTFRTLARHDDDTGALAEILQVREVLEEGLIRRVATALTEAELDRLEAVVDRMEAAGHAGLPFPELDREFHELLYAPLGNALVPQLLGAFWTVFRRVTGARGRADDPPPDLTVRRHRAIVTALRAHDVEGAQHAMAIHFRGIEHRTARGGESLADTLPNSPRRRPRSATAAEAAERGLHVWLQPTLADAPERDILEHMAECGRFAERLRRQGASVDFSVGCEFWLFVPGIVPGDTVLDRVRHMLDGDFDPVRMQRRLDAFTAKAAALGRSVFRGRLSYAAAQDDKVDWRLFDVVGIDYYSYHRHHADYVRELRRYLRWGKPLAITEFGTCAYVGAPEAGGMAWNVVDYGKGEIKGHLVRSEHTQAACLADQLAVFEAMGLYAAMAFEFVTPDAPHRDDDPRKDLDMASYSVTRTIKDRPDDPRSDWHWEPKKAFHALAREYGRRAHAQ